VGPFGGLWPLLVDWRQNEGSNALHVDSQMSSEAVEQVGKSINLN
jgi:hypothetical protein